MWSCSVESSPSASPAGRSRVERSDRAPIVVCVLGMSRSGTSLTTQVLNLAGVYLGPTDELLGEDLRQLNQADATTLARASDTNPKGFWEHYRIMRLNERILRRLGGSWREPPPLPVGWERSEDLAEERREARALLDRNFAGRSIWGWKDPRNSLTLPFWKSLLPEMRYVICTRNPQDVAASLRRRDGMSLEQAAHLWCVYVASALAVTSGGLRFFVPYERYFEDRRAIASRLAAFVGCDGAFDGDDARRRLTEAVDERLWRNRAGADRAGGESRLGAAALSLHRLTERLAAV